MNQESEQSESEEAHPAEYWKEKIDALMDYGDTISKCTRDLLKAGRITRDEAAKVYDAFNKVAIFDSGSPGLEYDALHYALVRNATHQMQECLMNLRPELQADLKKQFPNSPFRGS